MIRIKQIECNNLAENCYIVSDDTKECMIVDCGAISPFEQEFISKYIEENGLKVVLHALTHGHFDHCMGAQWISDTYGIRPTIHERDADLYKNCNQLAAAMGYPNLTLQMPPIGRCVNNGDTVSFGNTTFRVIHTPGHSHGCVVYYCEEEGVAFTGDTLFKGSIGTTSFPEGSMFQMTQSLRILCKLPEETKLFPGHGPATTMGYEGATNPFLE